MPDVRDAVVVPTNMPDGVTRAARDLAYYAGEVCVDNVCVADAAVFRGGLRHSVVGLVLGLRDQR